MPPLVGQPEELDRLLAGAGPILALAPMQAVTDLPFWRVLSRYGGPDVYWTEYIRVHSTSTLDAPVVKALVENPTGRPAIAQLIGNDIPSLVRAARELARLPVAAVDLNLGCPAPVVYRKCAGGGLLREPAKIDAILAALREALPTGSGRVRLTVKTRLGFADPAGFDALLAIFSKHKPDLVTVHGRTVADLYRTEVRYLAIRNAVQSLPCRVIANGNVSTPERAAEVLRVTGAQGLMIGRGCIRNPWIFEQIRAQQAGQAIRLPTGRMVLNYIEQLYDETTPFLNFRERLQVEKMKKYMNFIGEGVGEDFVHQIRRTTTKNEFFQVCRAALDDDRPMVLGGRRHEPLEEEEQLRG